VLPRKFHIPYHSDSLLILLPGRARIQLHQIPLNEDGIPVFPHIEMANATLQQLVDILDAFLSAVWSKCRTPNISSGSNHIVVRFLLASRQGYALNSMGESEHPSRRLLRYRNFSPPNSPRLASALPHIPTRRLRIDRILYQISPYFLFLAKIRNHEAVHGSSGG
jgi:hypothetical protein